MMGMPFFDASSTILRGRNSHNIDIIQEEDSPELVINECGSCGGVIQTPSILGDIEMTQYLEFHLWNVNVAVGSYEKNSTTCNSTISHK